MIESDLEAATFITITLEISGGLNFRRHSHKKRSASFIALLIKFNSFTSAPELQVLKK